MNPPRTPLSRLRRWLLALGVLALAGAGGAGYGVYRWGQHQLRVIDSRLADLRFEEAADLLDDYLRVRPADADARLAAARARRRAGDSEAAERHLDEFDRRHGTTAASSLERVLLSAERGALGDKEARLRARLEKGGPEATVVLEALARNYLVLGRLEEATACLDDLLAERPIHPRGLVWRAQIAGRQLDWDGALDAARRAVDLWPDSTEARAVWAEANERVGHTETAAGEYAWLYARGRRGPEVVRGLGRCYQDLSRFADARRVLDAFLAEQPARADVLVERGRLALREGGTGAAEPYFRRAAAADPDDADAHRFLLRCLEAGGDTAEAARVADQLRRVEVRAGRFEQLRDGVRTAPNEAGPRCRLGLYLLENGREDEGLKFLTEAVTIDPSHEPARAALAAHARRTGERGKP